MMSLTMPDDQVSAQSVDPRVMMVVPKYPYPVVGGLERQSHELAKALLECGIQVQALSGAFAPSHRAEESVEGVRVHRIPWTDIRWLRFFRTPFDLFFALDSRREAYDVVHVHQFSWFGLFAIVSARLLGKRILTKLANVGPLGIPGMLDLPFGGMMLRIMRLSDALVAMSRESISEATSHAFPPGRILATPNGIQLDEGPSHLTEDGSSKGPCKVVFVGRLSPEKGLDVLLRCWPDVKQAAGRPALLEIWGSGPLEEELRRLSCALGVQDSVIFRGHVDGVRERLKSMDIFVLNSLAEGNSNSILEAMAAGLPIVSTRVGGTPMLVGPEGGALLFDLGDHTALVEHLVRLIRDPVLRNAAADSMRRRVAENFDIRRVANTYAQTYRYLVSGKRDRISELSNPVIRERLRVVVTADFYLPAFRNGGPIRSIASLIERLGDEFHFSVLCREPHLVGSPLPPEQKGVAWVRVGKARVKYLSSRQLKFLRLRSLLRELDADVFYVNGFFSPFTRLILTLRLLGLLPKRRFVLVPHGEFSHGAISLKSVKKKAYIRVARAIGLYKDLIWQATSEPERDDILRWLPKVTRTHKDPVILAPNLPALEQQDGLITDGQCKEAGSLRVIFLSRIHPIKNLDYALDVLRSAKGTIAFDIYGPLEDVGYWAKCQGIIKTLPGNITIQYRGEVRPENVRSVFSEYHLFLFPTRSENFGYVIIEALGAGCPVATSDQTPWKDLREKNAGWWLPLSRPEEYRATVETMLAMDGAEFAAMCRAARAYASTLGADPGALEAYRRLFGVQIHNE